MRIILTFFAILIYTISFSQDTITIDPINGHDRQVKKIKYGKALKLLISNVNVYNTQLSTMVNHFDEDYGELPNITEFRVPNKSSKVDDTERAILDGSSFLPNNLEDSQIEITNNFYNNVQLFKTIRDSLNTKLHLKKTLDTLTGSRLYIPDVEKFKSRVKSIYNTTYRGKNTNDIILDRSIHSVNKNFEKLTQVFLQLEEAYLLLGVKDNLANSINSTYVSEDGEKALKIFLVDSSSKSTHPFTKMYESAKSAYQYLNENRYKITSNIITGLTYYLDIQNQDFNHITSIGPIESDRFEITPILQNKKGDTLKKFKPLIVRSYGRIKINSSAGYFLSFTKNESFSLLKNEDGSDLGIKRQSTDDITHSFGTLIHAYYQSKAQISFGASTGLSLNDNGNLAFYMGASMFMVEKNRLVFTAGLSYNKTQILNDANVKTVLTEDGSRIQNQFNFINSSDTEIRYESLYKPSLFVGVSYNIF